MKNERIDELWTEPSESDPLLVPTRMFSLHLEASGHDHPVLHSLSRKQLPRVAYDIGFMWEINSHKSWAPA